MVPFNKVGKISDKFYLFALRSFAIPSLRFFAVNFFNRKECKVFAKNRKGFFVEN